LEGIPSLSLPLLAIVLWLATASTALAYLLYNHALQRLSAIEMNVMLGLSPFATALFARLVLSENLSTIQYLGIGVAVAGILLVQKRNLLPLGALSMGLKLGNLIPRSPPAPSTTSASETPRSPSRD
jgi:drug/metabolite transporter (DMT)-like permease